jgi:hypothetical protein
MTKAARMPSRFRSSARQRGQALTEVVLSMLLVLIPAFLIGWALYGYGEVRTSALGGARYAAWERTVWRESNRPTGEIEKLMIERFFVRPDVPIRSTVGTPARNADLPSFYSLHNGDRAIDLEDARPILKLVERPEKTSTVATVYNTISSVMSILGAGGMELEDKGLYEAQVTVKLNAVRHLKVFEDLDLTVTQRAAVVTDGWSASGEGHERGIVKAMVPASALEGLMSPFRALGSLTPFGSFKPGCIRAGVVPRDMLPSGSGQVGGNC